MADLKEKYEKICSLKDNILCVIEEQINGDLSLVDAKELGEVTDMAKDMAEMIKLLAEAEYYYKVTCAMDEASDEETSTYLNKYVPEFNGKFYRNDMGYRDRMYYSPIRHTGEGKSPMVRKTYMEMKNTDDESAKIEELEHYMMELGEDITEMISGMNANEKQIVKQKLTGLASKIV